jgi:uncharacterized membrane protein
MTTRLALLDLVAGLQLDKKQAAALWRLAGFENGAPRSLPARMRLGMTLVGAGCVGLGLIFWVAANWSLLSRPQQFGLLQSLVLLPCAAGAAFGRGRAALGLFALIATGGLFAYFGQTYQTGADTWELFAAWAALALPLAFCARSDAVWSAWAIVASTGLALWCGAHTGFSARSGAGPDGVYMIATGGGLGLTLLLSKVLRRHTGAGDWAFGIAMVLTTILATGTALADLELSPALHYGFCLLLGGAAAAVLAQGRPFDVFSASVVGLALNVLLFAGLAKLLVAGGSHDNAIGILFVLAVTAALMLAGSVKLILMLARAGTAREEQGEQA